MFNGSKDVILIQVLEFSALLFIFVIGLIILSIPVLYVIDKRQSKQAVRHNFPVIGRFRYLFEELGVFFRQYFFALDREEMPFNRAERSWVYRAAKNIDNTIAFGSTRDLRPEGTVLFVNDAFPLLEEEIEPEKKIIIGPYCENPYSTASLFNISGMSYGAISEPAIRALSAGAAKAGCWMNTGEGGVSPFHLEGGADLVFQIGTAKYGVRDESGMLCDKKLQAVASHKQVKMFEIKLSQGAKPGKGGVLPGVKVTKEIALVRGIPVGKDSISPNRHHDAKNVEELLDLIERVRTVTGKPVGIKVAIGSVEWLDQLMKAITHREIGCAPDFITVDSADGGTGAAPLSLIDYMGLPIRESLPMVVDTLEAHGLRDRIKVIASGKLVTPAEVAWAYCAGADFVTSARGFMFSLGCIQALQCNRNTCPTGITTHNKRLQKGLNVSDKAQRVERYALNMVKEINMIAHSCGVKEPRNLDRSHVRVVTDNGRSLPLDQVFPKLH